MRRTRTVLLAALAATTFAGSSASASGDGKSREDHGAAHVERHGHANDTITWWCTNLNTLWHFRAPVIAGIGAVTAPDPSPIPDPCGSDFPVVVPEGSRFMPGGTFIWYTNKTYPPAVRAALETRGYHFRSHSPMEDFLRKLVSIRVEVWTEDQSTVIAEYSFDPRRFFRLVQTKDFDGKTPEPAYANPALGIDYSAEEMGRMPLVGFPVPAGPLPRGTPSGIYWAVVYWTLSEDHNDGLNVEDFNFVPGGFEFIVGGNRFFVP